MMKAPRRLVGCGILKNEIEQVLGRRQWDIDSVFLDSSLHVDFDRLGRGLTNVLGHGAYRNVVCYGTCHPQMDDMIKDSDSHRVPVQNCVELILGTTLFNRHLADGAFFLFEDWVRHWTRVTAPVFGTKSEDLREVFQSEHSYFLGIKTPCSGDFTHAAEKISQQVGLPLRWHAADLRFLEEALCRVMPGAE